MKSSDCDENGTVGVPMLSRESAGGGGGKVDKTGPAPSVLLPSTDTTSGIDLSTTVLDKDTTLPLPQSLGLACAYILTSMFFFVSIRYSKSIYRYNSAFLVVLIEAAKLCVSVALKYRDDGEFLPKTVFFGRNRRVVWRSGLPCAIPSLLYAVYNNLTFFNLDLVDPGTYQVFMQTRIIFTGILFTLFLHQALTYRKWSALILLSVGVAAKYFSPTAIQLDASIVYMLFQALLSSLAGVYNEYVFKKEPDLSIHQQNFFMYFYALFFNLGIGICVAPEYYMNMDVDYIKNPIFIVIVLLGAGTGLSAAFILKFINVIVKAFASAIEVLLTAVVAWMLLGEALTPQDVVAAAIVMVAVYVYYTKGVGDNKAVRFGLNAPSETKEERFTMDYVSEQLIKHRSIIVNVFFVETVYTFYCGRSLIVLALRLLFYVNVLMATSAPKPAVPPSAATTAAEASAGAAANETNTAAAPNYEATHTAPQRRAAPAGSDSGPSNNAATATTTTTTTANADADADADPFRLGMTDDDAEERKGSLLRDVILGYLLALLNHLIIPLFARGWSWYWRGPLSQTPVRGHYKTEALYVSAVSTYFAKDYSTQRALVDDDRYFMDFLAADTPPANLIYRLLLGNANLPLFVPILDVCVVVLQIIMLKMTFPDDYGLHICVSDTPALPPRSPLLRAEAGAGKQHGGDEVGEGGACRPTSADERVGGVGSRAAQSSPVPREALEGDEMCSSRSSERSTGGGGGKTAVSLRNHSTAHQTDGGHETLLSTAKEDGVSVELDGTKSVDYAEAMDEGDDSGAAAVGPRGVRRRRGRGHLRLPSPLAWLTQGGGLISGGGGDKSLPFLSSGAPPPPTFSSSHVSRRSGGGGGDASSAHYGNVASAPHSRGAAPSVSPSSGAPRRCTWAGVRRTVRRAVRTTLAGWRWELVTLEVPADRVPPPVPGTLITMSGRDSR